MRTKNKVILEIAAGLGVLIVLSSTRPTGNIKSTSAQTLDGLPGLRNIGSRDVFLQRISLESRYTPIVDSLMLALNENNFVQGFDWVSWQGRGASYRRNKKKLRGAKLETCVKLLTLHVRKDRYCANHFGEMLAEAHIQAILSRLLRLRAGRAVGTTRAYCAGVGFVREHERSAIGLALFLHDQGGEEGM